MVRVVRTSPAAAAEPPALPLRLPWSLGSGTILLGLNSAMIAVALIPMTTEFGDPWAIAWIVSSLYIAAAVGSPTGGRLADLFGPRRVYLVGLVVVLLASVLGPFVPGSELMIADRVLLGLGASVQFPAAMAIIRHQAERRAANPTGAIGIIAMCGQTTAALGPTVGGLVVLLGGWQGIFWINVPMVLLCGALVLSFVPKDAVGTPRRGWREHLLAMDPLGMLLLVATLVLLMCGLLSLEGDRGGWLYFAGFAPALALFLWRESRASAPFVDIRLMTRHPQFALTCLRALATFVSFYCIFYGLPQWLEVTRGLDAGTTGLLMLPVFGVGAVSTWAATRLGARWQPRALLAVGTTAMVVAGGLLALTANADAPLWWLAVVCALLGVPNGFNNLGNQLLLHHAVPAAVAGTASGVYRTAQYIGAALAAVVSAHALRGAAPNGGIGALGCVIGGLGLVLLVATIVALVRRGGRNRS